MASPVAADSVAADVSPLEISSKFHNRARRLTSAATLKNTMPDTMLRKGLRAIDRGSFRRVREYVDAESICKVVVFEFGGVDGLLHGHQPC